MKYKAYPNYVVNGDPVIVFDNEGIYETTDGAEIELLNSICPEWITCIEKAEETPKPKPKAPAKKTSGK